MKDLPPSLVRVVIDQEAAASAASNASVDPLFTKPANEEQNLILASLMSRGSVVVQGPPGTGKTHTIANLIGHVLAEGKTVLVTSQTSKALRVLREKVVEDLQPLCVAYLDSDLQGREQLEGNINAIVARLSTPQESVAETQRQRKTIKQQLAAAEAELQRARTQEVEPINADLGPSWTPRSAHRGHQDRPSWTPRSAIVDTKIGHRGHPGGNPILISAL
jgi:Rad3-related DNA helicase